MQTPYFSLPNLPWDRFAEDERNFRIIVGAAIAVFLVITVVFHSVKLPPKERDQQEVMPPRIAKLVTEIRLPPPKKEEPKPEPKPELKPEQEEKKPEPKPEEKPKEIPKETPKPKEPPKPTPKPVVKKEPTVTVQTAEQQQAVRKEAAKQEAQHAAAAFDALADLRTQTDVPASFSSAQQAVGSSALAVNDGPPAATQRNLIGKMAAGGSGGVQVAKASTGGGGAGVVGGTGKLGKVAGTAVTSSIGNAKVADPVKQNATATGPSGKAHRTTEQIQLVFDRYKGQIYAIYSRALREDPGLEGTLLLHLEIQPDGTVTACSVVSSELSNADLERKIVVKVKQLNFGSANVDKWSGNFPIKFFPS